MVVCHFPHLGNAKDRQKRRNIITKSGCFLEFFFFGGGGGGTSLLLYYQIQISVLFNLFSIFILFQNARSQPFKKIVFWGNKST